MNKNRFIALILALAIFPAAQPAFAFNFVGEAVRELSHLNREYTREYAKPAVVPTAGMSTTQGHANGDCPQFQAYGYPQTNDAKIQHRAFYSCRGGYAGMYDPAEKTPLWIAERLSAGEMDGRANRKGLDFNEDPQIPSGANAHLDDYKRSGYDKGHLAPAGDFRASQALMNQTFLLSNAVPQNPEHNRGIWANLEAGLREMTARRGDLYVITGPVYSNPHRAKIGRGVSVPDALYKVVVDSRKQEMTAFIIPNRADVGDDPGRYQVNVRDVERATGLNFNPNLGRADADRLEVGGGNWMLPRVRVRFND